MSDKELEKKIREAAVGGKIACKEAMKLAVKLGVPTKNMADLLNQYKVKIKECQLGCFK
jgi:LAO/AO transport system kinase